MTKPSNSEAVGHQRAGAVLRCQPWTPDDLSLLADLVDQGAASGRIADRMGRSRNSIIGKIYRLGLRPTARLVRPRKVAVRKLHKSAAVQKPSKKAHNDSDHRETRPPKKNQGGRRAVARPSGGLSEAKKCHEAVDEPKSRNLTLLQTKSAQCLFGTGQNEAGEITFCGHQTGDSDLRFCAHHHGRVYQSLQTKKSRDYLVNKSKRARPLQLGGNC